ncbi:N-acetylneuraminate synthase family protein [Gammaproteobacteria bacterium]|nr:N-acetylneuraminate synthase family protein [Gammaproteobacteria bacterium]
MNIIGENALIAEIAGNFRTVDEAVKLSIAAIENGAESIKLQTYDPEKLTSKQAIFDMPNTGVKNQYEVFRESMTDYGMQREIIKELTARKILIFSTPSHPDDVEFLETCGVRRYKIGSDDCSNHKLIASAGETGKPVIISTGMATITEVEITANFCERNNIKYALMLCTTNYPCQLEQLNLKTIHTYLDVFRDIQIGFSDHYPGMIASIVAASLGSSFFEKHVMLDDVIYGYDAVVSMKTSEIGEYLKNLKDVKDALGSSLKLMSKEELINRNNNRKSMFFTRNVKIGEKLEESLLIALRPGTGISPSEQEQMLGRKLKVNVRAGDMVKWTDLE